MILLTFLKREILQMYENIKMAFSWISLFHCDVYIISFYFCVIFQAEGSRLQKELRGYLAAIKGK